MILYLVLSALFCTIGPQVPARFTISPYPRLNVRFLFIMLYLVESSFHRSSKLSSAAILATFVCDITRAMSEQSL